MTLRIPARPFALLILPALVASAPATGPGYHVVAHIELEKAGADFLNADPVHRRLYGAGDKVIDMDRDSVVGSIPNAGGGYALAPELNRGLVRNGTLFDLSTLAVTGKVDGKGDASVYDPVTRRAFMLLDTVTVVDMTNGQIVMKRPVAPALESGVADGRGKLFINREDSSILTRVDAKTLAVEARYPIANCHAAQGLSMDRATRRLFLGCDKEMVVVDADNGAVVTRIPVAGHADENAFDSATKLAFNANRPDSTLVIVHEDSPDHYSVVATIKTGGPARSVALDEKSHKIYLFHRNGDHLVVTVLAP